MTIRGAISVRWWGLRRFLSDQTVESTLSALRLRFGITPIPLDTWRRAWAFNRIVSRRTLERSIYRLDLRSANLPPEVARHAVEPELSTWAIDAETARWLWRETIAYQPRVIIECGSGESTILFATSLTSAPGELPPPRIVSLDQSADFAEAVNRRVRAGGWAAFVDIQVAPATPEGSYAFDEAKMRTSLNGRAVDWIFVDGPVGYRTASVPSLARFARPGTRWLLDDAFGPTHFATVEAWSKWPGIKVDGIVPVGKGLAVGTISDPAAASEHLR